MTAAQRIIGFSATVAIAAVLITAILSEPQRQTAAQQNHRERAIQNALDLYALNCVECHGASGEGTDVYPELRSESISGKDEIQLFQVIERGRYSTEMAAFGIEEGGNLTDMEINNLVTLIQYGDWETVYLRVELLDLLWTVTPTTEPTATFTITPTPTSTLMPTRLATALATPTVADLFGIQPTESEDTDLFEIMPTATSESSSLFEIVPTPTAYGASSLFDILPTNTLVGTLFEIVPTSTPYQSLPFEIVPTPTP